MLVGLLLLVFLIVKIIIQYKYNKFNNKLGGGGQSIWFFKFNNDIKVPVITKLNFVYLRPFEGDVVNSLHYKIIYSG